MSNRFGRSKRNVSGVKTRRLMVERLEDRRLLAVWTVNTIQDVSPGSWETDDGVMSLREAVTRAGTGDVIQFDSDIDWGLKMNRIQLRFGEIVISKTITIDGQANLRAGEVEAIVTISGGGLSRVFDVTGGSASTPAALRFLAVTAGSADYGGGIVNSGHLTIVNCLIFGNSGYWGGGVANENGKLKIVNSTITGNSADYGGGFYQADSSSSVTMQNSIVARNNAQNSGSDIFNVYSSKIHGSNNLSAFTKWYAADSEDNITDNAAGPLFSDASESYFTLSGHSQAIDRGKNDFVETEVDLTGATRIRNEIVDIGAYEYQSGSRPLTAPEHLAVQGNGGDEALLTWDEVPEAAGYQVAYSADGVFWMEKTAKETRMVVSGLPFGVIIRYKIRSLDESGDTSDYSGDIDKRVCPMDVDGDGFIGPSDRALLSAAWLTTPVSGRWNSACDIDGDGFIGPLDYYYLSINWLKKASDTDLVYPPQPYPLPVPAAVPLPKIAFWENDAIWWNE